MKQIIDGTKWRSGKLIPATKEHIESEWGLDRGDRRLKCRICGHYFLVGELFRWVYMNGKSPSPGNFIVCEECDHPTIKDEVRSIVIMDTPTLERWVLAYRCSHLRREE